MKFGQTKGEENLGLPGSHGKFDRTETQKVPVAVGMGMWNRAKLKNFYPRGTEDELAYYSTQFNSVELNATFYKIFAPSQIRDWRERTAPHFTFVPKIPHEVSHIKRLRDFEGTTAQFVESISNFGDKLGGVFLQCHNNFGPECFHRLQRFIEDWRQYCIPLAVEVRATGWHDEPFAESFYRFLEDSEVQNILIDTAGRRDLMHMRMTTPVGFIRFVGCGVDEIDFKRLEDWAQRISEWQADGLKGLYFFIHQHEEKESPKLARHFILQLNRLGVTDLEPPTILTSIRPPDLIAPGTPTDISH